jgi:hypothetical protein
MAITFKNRQSAGGVRNPLKMKHTNGSGPGMQSFFVRETSRGNRKDCLDTPKPSFIYNSGALALSLEHKGRTAQRSYDMIYASEVKR